MSWRSSAGRGTNNDGGVTAAATLNVIEQARSANTTFMTANQPTGGWLVGLKESMSLPYTLTFEQEVDQDVVTHTIKLKNGLPARLNGMMEDLTIKFNTVYRDENNWNVKHVPKMSNECGNPKLPYVLWKFSTKLVGATQTKGLIIPNGVQTQGVIPGLKDNRIDDVLYNVEQINVNQIDGKYIASYTLRRNVYSEA